MELGTEFGSSVRRRTCVLDARPVRRRRTESPNSVPSAKIDAIATVFGKLPTRILADLANRAVDFGRDGTDAPAGPLSSDGKINGRRLALVVPLVVPPVASADMWTETAHVDRARHRYWALRSGGFIATTQWVGPLPLPRSGG